MGVDTSGKKFPPKKEAIRQLQKVIKDVTDYYIPQPALELLLDQHWSKLSYLAHAYKHGETLK